MRYPSAYFKPVGLRLAAGRFALLAAVLLYLFAPFSAVAQGKANDNPAQPVAGASTVSAPVDSAPVDPTSSITPSTATGPSPLVNGVMWLPVGPPCPPELRLPLAVPQFEPPPPPPPEPAAKLHPQRVLLIGDSLMQNGCLGSQLEVRFKQCKGVQVARWAKQSTGLARKDYFDWAAKLKELIAKHQPDLIVAIWGANDCQSVTNSRGKALAVFGTEAWDKAYGERVEEMTAIAHDAGAELVIIGLPSMRNEKYGARIARLNSVVEKHAQQAGGVYLPTWNITSGNHGSYLASIKYNGKNINMRQKDGIHLSNGGAGYVSDWLMGEMGKLFELTR